MDGRSITAIASTPAMRSALEWRWSSGTSSSLDYGRPHA
jgi:hypothetical protein